MFTEATLRAQIVKIIDTTTSQGRPAPAAWIVQTIMISWPEPGGEAKDAWLFCAREHIRDAVRQAIRGRKALEVADERQYSFGGFKHVQRDYVVERDGDQIVVPLHLLSNGEVEAKAAELRRMARGCDDHADELLRYLEERRASA